MIFLIHRIDELSNKDTLQSRCAHYLLCPVIILGSPRKVNPSILWGGKEQSPSNKDIDIHAFNGCEFDTIHDTTCYTDKTYLLHVLPATSTMYNALQVVYCPIFPTKHDFFRFKISIGCATKEMQYPVFVEQTE